MQAAASAMMEAPQEKYRLDLAAASAGYSVAHFTRLFRSHAGVNPEQFAIRARVHRAERLLRETDMSITQIAKALDYSDICYFSRQFKKVNGQSPREYRRPPKA